MFELKHVNGDAVRDIRRTVFAEEQGYPIEKLFDEYDASADFIALFSEGDAVGCGRFYKEDDTAYHIDNIAFKKEARGNGCGKKLVAALVASARKKGAKRVTVNARSDAVGFYEKCGFAACGCEFDDENFKRVPMVLSFEFENCDWLRSKTAVDAYFARKKFTSENAVRAVLRVGVLGFIEPYVNGKKLTEEYFIPALSDYHKRDLTGAAFPIFDTLCHRRYYLEYDITELLTEKKNVFTAHIGGGWYKQIENKGEKMPVWGEPSLIFCIILTMKDGSETRICSDETVHSKASFVKKTNIYTSEIIDGREYDTTMTAASYNDADWDFMVRRDVPPAVAALQDFSGDTKAYAITPELLFEASGEKIYDLKKDVAGLWVVRFDDDAVSGDIAEVSIAEAMDENYHFLLRHTGGENRQVDTYICGNKREFSPVFTWRAGRFVKVKGKAQLVRFDVVFSPVSVTALLHTKNENLKWFFDAYCNTQNCNIHDMIPSDCPHRERLGYTGDGQLCSGAAMTIFDSETMYRKWLDDIADCQDIFGGHVQHTAPFLGGGGGPGGWGGAMVIVPWNFYKKFGDVSVLEKYYPRMMKYLDYMQSRCENHIVVREEKGGWCLGDWCPPDNDIQIPEAFVNTYFYIKCLMLTKSSAEVLGYSTALLSEKIKTVSDSFVVKYFDEMTGSFAGGVQGADAFAVDLGLGDERTIKNLAAHYEALGHYDTGIFGTDIVTRVLFENGYDSLAWQLLTNDSDISFSYMRRHGATTLWENWDGCDSLSHPMFGAVAEYIFTYILGIKQTADSCGYKKITIAPAYLPEGGDISGSIMTKHGTITVSVCYRDAVRAVQFSVPDKIEICD